MSVPFALSNCISSFNPCFIFLMKRSTTFACVHVIKCVIPSPSKKYFIFDLEAPSSSEFIDLVNFINYFAMNHKLNYYLDYS